jgi:dipeptide/tripeptide permease
MEEAKEKKGTWKSFPGIFWLVVVFEFFERGSYYGMMSVLSVYLTDELMFSKEGVGIIKSTIQPILYFLPIISGALADRFGYRPTLTIAFSLLGFGYFLTSQMTSYSTVFMALVIMALGAGTFKPIISGTIAKVTDKDSSTLGFGIYYWSINLGAFLFPLILVPYLKNNIGWDWVIIASAIGTGIMVLPTLLFFKEPPKPKTEKSVMLAIAGAQEIILSPILCLYHRASEQAYRAFRFTFLLPWSVFVSKEKTAEIDPPFSEAKSRDVSNFKFLLMIFIYSCFWILYFQMFDSVLWYVNAYVDASVLDNAVNSFLHYFRIPINWKFDVEHVTVINAGTIILLQLLISAIVKNTRALPTMVVGICMGTIGMAILAISTNIWVFLVGIIIFSIGEMTAHPKFISYIALIAPRDKVAMYMGYIFLYGVIGSSIGGVLGAYLYVHFVDELNQPRTLWLIFSSLGVITIIGLLLYNKFLAPEGKNQAE